MRQDISKDNWAAALLNLARLDGAVQHGGLKEAWSIRAAMVGFAEGSRLPDKRAFYLGLLRGDETQDIRAFSKWFEMLSSWTKEDTLPPPLPSHLLFKEIMEGDPLELPIRLYHSGFTHTMLPCLTQPHKVKSQAEQGLMMLKDLNQHRAILAQRLSHKKHDHRLWHVAALFLKWPALTPSSAAQLLGLSISGAGKLLQRAALAAICVETSGQHNYKLYVSADCVKTFGLGLSTRNKTRHKGPFSPMDQKYELALRHLDDALKLFDDLVIP